MDMLSLGVGDICYLLLICGFGFPAVVGCLASVVACHVSPTDYFVMLRGTIALAAQVSISFNKRKWKYATWSVSFSPLLFCFFPLSHEIMIPHEPFEGELQIGYPFTIIDFHLLSFLCKNIFSLNIYQSTWQKQNKQQQNVHCLKNYCKHTEETKYFWYPRTVSILPFPYSSPTLGGNHWSAWVKSYVSVLSQYTNIFHSSSFCQVGVSPSPSRLFKNYVVVYRSSLRTRSAEARQINIPT